MELLLGMFGASAVGALCGLGLAVTAMWVYGGAVSRVATPLPRESLRHEAKRLGIPESTLRSRRKRRVA